MRFPFFPFCPTPYSAPRVIEKESIHSSGSASKAAFRGDSVHWVTSPQQLGEQISQQPPLPPPRESFFSKISRIFIQGDASLLLRNQNALVFEQGELQNKIISHCQTLVEARKQAWQKIPEVHDFFNTLYPPQKDIEISNVLANTLESGNHLKESIGHIPFVGRDNPSFLSALFERKVLNDLIGTQSIPADGQQYQQILNAIDPLIFWKKVLDETEKALQQGDYLLERLLINTQLPDRAPFFLDDPLRYQQNTNEKQLSQALPYLKAKAFQAHLGWINALIHPQADVQKIQKFKSAYEQQTAHIQAIEAHIEILKSFTSGESTRETVTQDSSLDQLRRLLQAEQKNPILNALSANGNKNQEKDS
ncbi:MAG: hypothetical protein K2X66_19210 [Cyanobacteria bacterium]|nr:hypothetical protein [Cyanobacteriota bacterium]